MGANMGRIHKTDTIIIRSMRSSNNEVLQEFSKLILKNIKD